jgi:hypothetical protein
MNDFSIHPSDDHLIDLAADLPDPAGRAALLEHLRACASCEARFLELYRVSERLALRPIPAVTAAAPRASGESRAAPSAWLRIGSWAAVAALLVTGLLFAPRFLHRRPADGLDYWMPLENERVLLRSADVSDDFARFGEAIDAYTAHDAPRVIALLRGRELAGSYEPLNLLLASALVWEGRNTEARDLLGRLDTLTLPEPARDRARFLLYVALRRDGRQDEARAIARELAAGTGEFAGRARALVSAP